MKNIIEPACDMNKFCDVMMIELELLQFKQMFYIF